jgi:hypothetical protein
MSGEFELLLDLERHKCQQELLDRFIVNKTEFSVPG